VLLVFSNEGYGRANYEAILGRSFAAHGLLDEELRKERELIGHAQ
jgi:hypothetical protein